MKLSYRWLERHVDLSGISADEVAVKLTLHTCEVEGVEPFAPQLTAVTVGHVLEREPHPDADKLGVCKVDVGADEPLQIVCGAPNVGPGQRVAVATVGTILPGDFKIKKSKIRGVASHGMICSKRELELGDEHDGIWVLPEPDAAVGTPVAEALGIQDHVLEIDNKSITHRADLWGHRGMARELAALFGRVLKPLDTSLPESGDAAPIALRVEDERCPRYLGLPIHGVRNEPSPLWMQLLLLAVDQRPLDLLVDLSNFVMLDLAQPNHLFDARRVEAGIEVRAAKPGETMQTLDEIERKLTPDDLLICSGGAPVALAGVMGGEASKVAADTTSLLLEVANFHGTTIRRTAARIGLRTDASARFEKSLDPNLPLDAAGHLVRLLQAIQPEVQLPARIADAGEWTDPSSEIALAGDAVRGLLGVELTDEQLAKRLERLEFGVQIAGGVLQVAVPSFRASKDITTPEDLIEEIGRSIGYGEIPGKRLIAEVAPPARDAQRELGRRIADRLAGAGRFSEAPGYSFQPESLTVAAGEQDAAFVSVVNPVAEGDSRVRRSVVPALLQKLAPNLRRCSEVRLFEVGKGYLPEHRNERGEPREVRELGLSLAVDRAVAEQRFDSGALARLRGATEDLLRSLGRAGIEWSKATDDLPTWSHPSKALELSGAEGRIGVLAQVHPQVAKNLGIEADAAAAAIDLLALQTTPQGASSYRPVPRFPGVKLDVAFALAEETSVGEVTQLIVQSGKGLVGSTELFDVYRGDNLGAGKKSLAFHVVLQAADRTLVDKDQAKFLDRLERTAERSGVELRRG